MAGLHITLMLMETSTVSDSHLPEPCQRCSHQMAQQPIPPIQWVGYPPSLEKVGPQSVTIYANGDHVGISLFLLVDSGSGLAGSQYQTTFSTPQELWDFCHQLTRETQTVFANYFNWTPPQGSLFGNLQKTKTKRAAFAHISLDDLEL